MNLNARDGVTHDQAAPLRVDRRRLLQNREDPFDQPDAPVGLRGREAEPSPRRRRPRADVSELYNVLGRAAELVSARQEGADGLSDCAVVGVVAL